MLQYKSFDTSCHSNLKFFNYLKTICLAFLCSRNTRDGMGITDNI
jgi:hypothetical protein